jgi:hypothetical protein
LAYIAGFGARIAGITAFAFEEAAAVSATGYNA